MPPFDKKAEQLFASVYGRPAKTREERAFLQSAAGRKSGAQLQGALEYARDVDKRFTGSPTGTQKPASTNPVANVSPKQEVPMPDVPDVAPVAKGAENDVADAILSTTERLRQGWNEYDTALKSLKDREKKLILAEEKATLRQEILKNDPELQELVRLKASMRGDIQSKEFPIEGAQSGITDPEAAARLSLEQRGRYAESASLLADDIRQRETGVRSTIDALSQMRQQEFENAQLAVENARSYISDILAVRADERAAITSDLQNQKLRSDLTGGVISKEKLLELVAEFGPEALGELQHSLGMPPVAPFVQNVTGYGYQNGDNTFYGTKHKGIDIMVPENSPIQASVPLTITNVFEDAEGGLTVYGKDSQGTVHKFLHLNQSLVNVGDVIDAGQVIALSGNTGTLTTGPHLHFELEDANGNNIDPRQYALPGQTSFVSRREKEQMAANAKAEDDLRGEYIKQSGSFIAIQQAYDRVQSAATDPSPAGDLALIFNYMKILDPGSVVREGEFATAQNSAGVPEIVRAKYNKLLQGERLSENTRKDFVDRAKKLYDGKEKLNESVAGYYRNLADQRGLNPENVVVPYGSFTQQQPQSAATDADYEYLKSIGL